MSDFRNISDFRKAKTSKYQYQDPTYLSFVILFDFNDLANSPLLSGAAEGFLEKLVSGESNANSSNSAVTSYYAEKLAALREFKRALITINNDMPWYWQTLGGLEVLQQWDPLNPYFGRDDAKLTIDTLESLNLPIAGLMYLYRKAVFDERKWNWVIPENLRQFRMYIYVTEVRKIKNLSQPTINNLNLTSFPDNFKPSIGIENKNEGISGQSARPYFMFGLKYCEFDLTSGTNPFVDLQKSPTETTTNQITIKYEALHDIQARVLNGIITELNPDNLSPASDSENKSFDNLGEYVNTKFNNKVNELKDRSIQDLKILADQKVNQLSQAALDATINRIPTVDNIYQNFVQGVDDITDVTQQTRNIGRNIQENVFGSTRSTPEQRIQDALDDAALKSLGNVYD